MSASHLITATLVFLLGLTEALSMANRDSARNFLDHCASAEKIQCSSYECYASSRHADLRQMDALPCYSSGDCLSGSSGMACIKYDTGKAFCECPRNYAFNTTSCSCEQAQRCPPRNLANASSSDAAPTAVSSPETNQLDADDVRCHNGLECSDSYCSCRDLTSFLYDAQARVCLLPRVPGSPWFDAVPPSSGGGTDTFLIIVIVIAVCVCIAFLAVGIYILSEDITCNQGDYKCEDDIAQPRRSSGRQRQAQADTSDPSLNPDSRHVAAWDLPSLDYLSEEQTMKYIQKHELEADQNRSAETSVVGNGAAAVGGSADSPSPSGSLPECDSSVSSSRYERVNRAFVHDAATRKDSKTMEEPKEV